jgi:predicted transcriptional regulator
MMILPAPRNFNDPAPLPLGWSQEALAKEAAISIPTVKRLEARDGELGGRSETVCKLRTALESAGIEFIGGNEGLGVKLRQ